MQGAEGRLSPIALSGNGSLRSIADSLEDKRSVHKPPLMPLMRNAQPWLKARSMHRRKAPPLPGLLISKKSETLYPASQRKKPHKKEPSSA